ncbi:hypothetical protein [Vogesella indigofera]|uniref:hypothetical protein n=1 Tax=Vogesella indigofera TaxID=45465 RepID=UPI00234E23B6|nr:hypothetical protein [Vogesella indigofera]MDC7705887.1 hypothetical protein [Vogesella indigofera]
MITKTKGYFPNGSSLFYFSLRIIGQIGYFFPKNKMAAFSAESRHHDLSGKFFLSVDWSRWR